MNLFFHKSPFHPQMTPKTHEKKYHITNLGKITLKKKIACSQPLLMALVGPKNYFFSIFYQSIALMEIFQLCFNLFSKFSLYKKFLLWLAADLAGSSRLIVFQSKKKNCGEPARACLNQLEPTRAS